MFPLFSLCARVFYARLGVVALLEVKDLCFNYSDKELYRNVSFKLNHGEHCVLVGVNGSGKTTLLSLIVGELRPDKGSVSWEPHVTFSYLDQQLKVKNDMPVKEYLYGVYQDLFDKERRMQELYEKAAYGEEGYEALLDKAMRLGDELEQSDFYSLQEKVGRLTDGLGFNPQDLEKPLALLSSGQREKRISRRCSSRKRTSSSWTSPRTSSTKAKSRG